ncbi:hypothetical protein [Streptomyces sp. NPDC018711]|uniref:hypothetical protein n=1 Tax=Streptomyces sp. NPDC018711 TaxID=3365052 RepID=UPI003795E559
MWWLFVSSTKASGYLYTGTPLWFSPFDLVTNIRDVCGFEDGIFSTRLANSALYSLVGIRNNYLLPSLMLNTSSLQPVTVGLVRWRSEFANGVPPPLPITGAFLSLIPLLVAFVGLQRFWRKGLTAGSVK